MLHSLFRKAFKLLPVLLAPFLVATLPAYAKESPAGSSYNRRGPVQLEDLAEPIALYPDSLLQPMLPAATFPDQIVDAALLIKSKQDAPFIQVQDWDASVKVIATYPGVLKMMSDKIAWTTELGEVFLNQREDLFTTIQNLRTKAQELGNLKSDKYQTVSQEKAPDGNTIIVVQPADPEVVYVPESSTTVYTESTSSALVPLASFGLGMALGAAINDDDDNYYYGGGYWGGGSAYWYDDDRFDKWADNRRAVWEDYNDRAWDRQEHRQEMSGNRQDYRREMAEQGNRPADSAARQQKIDDFKAKNPQAASRVDSRQASRSQGSFSRTGSGDFSSTRDIGSSRSYSGSRDLSDSNRAALQQRSTQARSSYQQRSASTSRSGFGGSSSAFQGYGSRSSTMAASSRGSMSRSSGMSRGGGGARMGGGGGGRGGGRR